MDKKHYTVIVGSGARGWSISNDTDWDPMTDYSPGMWACSRKSVMKWAKEYIDEGHTVRVTTYDNPNYAKWGNEAIAELGLTQEPFKMPEAVPESRVTNGRPSNLSQLKKYAQVGVPLRIKNRYLPGGTCEAHIQKGYLSNSDECKCQKPLDYTNGQWTNERETEVARVQTNSITTWKYEPGSTESWLEWGKASNWTFDNDGATLHYTDRDTFAPVPSVRIEYL